MNDRPGPPLQAPTLKAVLLTDICDSVAVVEKLGDAAAAQLFQQHDLLVLQLQQQWKGRLIDRSDGLLLLFERPIDGVGFALDYLQGLGPLGARFKVKLQARAGLHVGEVLVWENSPEAIKVGAKAMEVEGLAKPMAARLMTLARPGQLLLSAVAETLAQRGARDIGERGARLLWKSHGRWRFKGVPTVQEIYEVGEIGNARLRMPKATPKAWRDLPLWRRPVALAMELLLLVGLAGAAWLLTRPEPAIAFGERDWVVVGDVSNLSGEPLLDDSLQQAIRISLEQSRYVNVLSELKVQQTLKLMRRNPLQTRLDRTTASEVALRDGARAVVLPTITSTAGRTRVTLEVVDPASHATVYTFSQSSSGLDGVLAAVDNLNDQLRRRLGEALADIGRTSEPLPKVATADLDALRAYAWGSRFYIARNFDLARTYFQKAIELDPQFALAYLGVVRTYVSTADNRSALPFLEKARALRDGLPAREAMYLDAWIAELGPTPWKQAPARWEMLSNLYPDYYAGTAQSAWADFTVGRYASAFQKNAVLTGPQNPMRDVAVELEGRIHLAQGNYAGAIDAFARAEQLGGYPPTRRHAAALAAAGRYKEANRILSSLSADQQLTVHFERIALALDQGQGAQALAAAAAARQAAEHAPLVIRYALLVASGVVGWQLEDAGFDPHAMPRVARDALRSAVSNDAGDREDLALMAAAAMRLAQRTGLAAEPEAMQTLGTLSRDSGNPVLEAAVALLRAEEFQQRGEPIPALTILRQTVRSGPEFFQVRVALRDALRAAGEEAEAGEVERWLLDRRGLAFIEPFGALTFQAMNVADLARLAPPAAGRNSTARPELAPGGL
ncbi:putative peptide modification system cyclase [Stenotrophomonas sp. YIM B06876]|uniref:putative peptide modification system cyclase n=1 Tax=Stenotrophomonas sp. YIM B06876 TaxID=3060211 RepID=UPI0027385336|nr:putative peptide modification system cyclase [Stenotrophomonas sp. YIM B06876]